MKTHKSPIPIVVLLAALALLLSACQVNFITDIKNDGSGTYTQEIGFQGDEASMSDLNTGDQDFCASQNADLPPGTTIRQETRNENETWCIYETLFNSLEDLKAIYGTTDTLVNNISIVDGKLTYDIALDFSGDSGGLMGADIFWIVTLPGKISENNATQQDGNTLTWKLLDGQTNNIRVVSDTGGLNLGGDVLWYILGGSGFLCLCCFVPLVIVGVVLFLQRRKKNDSASDIPVESPGESPAS